MPILECPACGNQNPLYFNNFYLKNNVPVTQNVCFPSHYSAQNAPQGSLNLKQCTLCGMIHNADFNPVEVVYNTNAAHSYENNCFFSGFYARYVEEIIELLKTRFHIQKARILEIACGNGEFLKRLCLQTQSYGIGFDPACPPPRKTRLFWNYTRKFTRARQFLKTSI